MHDGGREGGDLGTTEISFMERELVLRGGTTLVSCLKVKHTHAHTHTPHSHVQALRNTLTHPFSLQRLI